MSEVGVPPRLLMTADAVGGVWVYALALGAALVPAGVAVTLAVLGPAPGAEQRAAAAQAGVTLVETGLALDWTAESAAELQGITAALARLARGHDLVQLHSPALVGDADWPAPVVAVAHSCVGTWWAALRGAEAPPADFVWRMDAMRSGLARADAVVAPSAAFAAALRDVYRPPPRRPGRPILAVHNGRDFAAGAVPGLGAGVLACGRLWDGAKNVALLDAAAARMAVPVAVAGATQGPNGVAVAPRAVTVLGVLGDAALQARMQACRVFASPARYEPFGLAVLEAAQCARPLVLADIPTFRELWDGAAVFLPPEDSNLWAETLTALHDDPAACAAWGAKARARAERYTVAALRDAMLRVYAPLLPDARAAA